MLFFHLEQGIFQTRVEGHLGDSEFHGLPPLWTRNERVGNHHAVDFFVIRHHGHPFSLNAFSVRKAGNFCSIKGVDVGTVRKLLGHSSLLVTQRYIHADEQIMRTAVESLAKTGNLLHSCDTGSFKKSEGKIETPVTSFLSMN